MMVFSGGNKEKKQDTEAFKDARCSISGLGVEFFSIKLFTCVIFKKLKINVRNLLSFSVRRVCSEPFPF